MSLLILFMRPFCPVAYPCSVMLAKQRSFSRSFNWMENVRSSDSLCQFRRSLFCTYFVLTVIACIWKVIYLWPDPPSLIKTTPTAKLFQLCERSTSEFLLCSLYPPHPHLIFGNLCFSMIVQSKLDDYQTKKNKGERLNQDQLVRQEKMSI